MQRGFKHAISCKCGETIQYYEADQYDTMEKMVQSNVKSTCCHSSFEYIGLRPYYENILKIPTEDDFTPSNTEEIKPIAENPKESRKVQVVNDDPEIIKPTVEELITSVDTNLKIDDIIQPGPSGVTNKQMIPALKEFITNEEIDKIKLLKQTYPEIFEGSCKYIGKKLQDKLASLI